MLADEPFNLTIPEIRKLTDWQIKNVYFLPQLRKAAKRELELKGKDSKAARRWQKNQGDRLPSKKEFFLIGEKLGYPPEQCEREWQAAMNRGEVQDEPERREGRTRRHSTGADELYSFTPGADINGRPT